MRATRGTFAEALGLIAASKHILLTTYRKNGNGVSTPVGSLVHDGTVYVLTDPGTGKVKRIRNSGAVHIAPCSMGGTVPGGAPATPATARLLDAAETGRVQDLMTKRFVMYRLVRIADRILRRRRPLIAIAITAR
ncbi:PPOX class F420-dependent oxidoreductase [Streptomyces sp. NPDC048489]|uniref:PPOX class F420-dependent oxidoreductase n=1 Tax=Streptomyces sp. NPDC048489 TaxID=3154504 RepID=UPI0034454E4F